MPRILGPDGQPIDTGLLKTTLVQPTTTGVRQVAAASLQGLDAEELGRLLRNAVQGDATAYLQLAEDMEEKYLHYGSELSTRKRALVGLELYVEPAGEDAASHAAAQLVEEALDPIRKSLFDLLDAIGKGFSVHEIDWETSARQWMPKGLNYLQPYWFTTRKTAPDTLFLRSDLHTGGEPLAPYKFVVHQVKAKSGVLMRGGLARMAAWAFLFSNYAIKDWVVFAEAYGQPLRVGKYDSSATAEDIGSLLMALRQLGTDAAAAIPKNMEIEFVDAGNKTASVDIYDRLAAYFDKQISKVVLGQTLSTNTGDGGGGAYALGKVHNEVREDILESDVAELESTLSRDYVRPVVDLNLGPQAAYPKIRLRINKPEDLTALAGVVDKLVRAGLPVSQESAYTRFGLTPPKPGEAILVPVDLSQPQQAMNRYRAANSRQPTGEGGDVDPLVTQLAEAAGSPLDRMLAVIRQALDDAPDLETFRDWLLTAFGDLPSEQLQDVMATAFSLATLAGRYEVSHGR
ncbi:Mu-like prophage FluMu protein gp29 [Pseudogulbenkiania sp. NH8B]|uniref:DUF935 domain-containing protein n=1 Tax=Pseudogulbenkiania sp. (strain NH8B) TaxID=748280 RepID=UPI0002279B4B|nr:DUF935 domain-containing protein [Pseudogulbenkiania sp. NH8B]BAK76480.1 Mu-like prophage FluMu protein gp29 [Pseudogulbenkiania sp. NH8B]BAK76909.1 Mu-like prophage FluMu protein gp29 [Pseudogulbenkiania sp. NH8B]